MSVSHLGKVEHINVYYDPEQEKDRLLFGSKSNSNIKQGFIWVPHTVEELWEMADEYQRNSQDNIVKAPKRTKKDYDFVIGNSMDLDAYKKALKLME